MGKILVVADRERECCATPRGLELAHKLGMGVDVVAFVHVSMKTIGGDAGEQRRVRERLVEARRQEVQALIDGCSQPGQKVGLKVVWEKHIDRWIVRECARTAYRWVLKTGHRTESIVHTSTDWQLLRECPAPVLLVARRKWHRTRPVLVALDLVSHSRAKQALNDKVLGEARALAGGLGVDLRIIVAVEIPALLAELDMVDPIAFMRDARKDMQGRLAKLADAHGLPETAFVCKRGPVEKVITSQAAEERAQIVVMGTVGRKGVKARLLGNTAEQVLRHLRTDVLAIKP